MDGEFIQDDVVPVSKRTRRSRTSVDPKQVIRVLSQWNPKRVDTNAFRAFEIYRDGMTVEEYFKSGGLLTNLETDQRKGYIRLDQPE